MLNREIYDKKLIRKNYSKSSDFIIDLICLIPSDLVVLILIYYGYDLLIIYKLCFLPKLLRYYKIKN